MTRHTHLVVKCWRTVLRRIKKKVSRWCEAVRAGDAVGDASRLPTAQTLSPTIGMVGCSYTGLAPSSPHE